MTFTHGKDSVFKLDNTAGSLTDISTYLSENELAQEIELADVTAYGDEGHKNIAGLENSTGSFSGHWDSAEDDIIGSTTQRKAGTRSFEYGPNGSTTGMVKYSGEVWINTYSVSSSVSDKVSFSGSMTVDGTVTRGTWA
jgi:hypothetical protein